MSFVKINIFEILPECIYFFIKKLISFREGCIVFYLG